MRDSMRVAVKWGVVWGAAILAWTTVVHLLGFYTRDLENGRRADVAVIVIPFAVLLLALRERRERNPTARLPLSRALGTAVLVGWISIPITVGGLWIYHHQVNPAWLDLLVADERARLAASGTAAGEVAARVARLRAGGTDAAQLLASCVGTTLLSLVLALPIALVLRRQRAGRHGPATSPAA